MMYAFMQLDDGTEVVHSEAYDDNGTETVKVYFEKPVEGDFESAECYLPRYARIFKIGGYLVYFWSNENSPLEPVHVHVSKGIPSESTTKIWITRSGRCLLCKSSAHRHNGGGRFFRWWKIGWKYGRVEV